jgi:aconitate hydratase
VLKGKTVAPELSFTVTPGSKQVYAMIARNGALADLIASGARILESACGPCIGMGQAPPSGAASVRSFNRNFEGRSGTPNDLVFLASPETCAAAALTGTITDPRKLGEYPRVELPEEYLIDDNMILAPSPEPEQVEIIRGPNIKPLPIASPLADSLAGEVLLKVGDNISTDHIMPAGAKILPLRSNIPAISEYVFTRVDADFPKRAKEKGGGLVVGGENYGQGSSREHAALAPMYLGLKAVIAKSFARIHWVNLINFGILPFTFVDKGDYDNLAQGDLLEMPDIRAQLQQGTRVKIKNVTRGIEIEVQHSLTPRQVEIILAGGLLNSIKQGA